MAIIILQENIMFYLKFKRKLNKIFCFYLSEHFSENS